MKKILMMGAAVLMITAPALADNHSGDAHGGKKGKMFQKMDADGDGAVSKDEFVKAHEERFDKMDADGNGTVTEEEAKAAGKKWREHRKEKRAERKAKETTAE